jgi:hypothetical protein
MFAKYKYVTVLALASVSSTFGNFADSVVSYNSGVGYAVSFSGVPYTNPNAALGQPNRDTSFGPVQPFNPPYEVSEIVSIGTDGFLVLRMDAPIFNSSANLFGMDFIIYGSAGFIDADYPNGRTDSSASLFGDNQGTTRISVSPDNTTFYVLNPSLAPIADRLFPTDGAGTFGVPVNPALTQNDFANLSLAQIRDLYAGSAGGASYDIAWAQDASGNPVSLDSIQYIRIDALSPRAEIDGIAAVPEPGTWVLMGCGCALLWVFRRSRRV